MKISKKLLSLGLTLSLFIINTPNVDAAVSSIERIQGNDYYETSVKVAEKQNYSTAIILNADTTIADGLSASGLSGTVDAPILLTSKDNIPTSVFNKLSGVKKVYIIGGTASVSQKVENKIKSKGIEVKRIGGSDRIETSYNVAKEISSIKPIKKIMLANAYKGEADAMSISPVAVRDDSPIILTNGNSIPFNAKNIESYVIGGTSTMSEKLVQDTNSTRLGGVDRFDTNKKIVKKFYPNAKEFHITKGWSLVDALITSPIAKDSPTILVDNYSDKTILNGATKITAVGDIGQANIDQSIHASRGVYITQNAEVHFINVGQGDSTYIELADGTDILIDGGESKYGTTVVNYLKNLEKNIDLEYVIATHPDSDHVGGLQEVFKQLDVKNFYYPVDAPHNTQTWNNVLNLAKAEGCKVLDAKSGTTLNIGGAVLKFAHPATDYKDNNEDSVVTLLDYNNTEVLLTGDAESTTENDMVNQNLVGDVDVLKVGHHGSNSSTTQAFLNKVKPEHSVISVGENSYGHPTSTILNRLVNSGSKVWRTDKNGNVILTTDGYTYSIKANGNPTTTPVPDSGDNSGNDNATDTSQIVYANGGSSSSNKYHKSANAHGMKDAIKMTENEAKKKGYIACGSCYR